MVLDASTNSQIMESLSADAAEDGGRTPFAALVSPTAVQNQQRRDHREALNEQQPGNVRAPPNFNPPPELQAETLMDVGLFSLYDRDLMCFVRK